MKLDYEQKAFKKYELLHIVASPILSGKYAAQIMQQRDVIPKIELCYEKVRAVIFLERKTDSSDKK